MLARDLAISLIATHLESAYDVIVPQFLGRLEFIERLHEAAIASAGDAVSEVYRQRSGVIRVDASGISAAPVLRC